MAGGIIVNGLDVPLEAPVLTYEETGLVFTAGVHRRTRHRHDPPDTITWHWTGGEPRDASTTYKVLRHRGLGVEFALDRDGTIWQFCDPALTDARDCGSYWDARSVGVEMINYGSRAPASKPWSWHVPKRGRDRPVVQSRLRGRTVYVADFTAEQYAAADALADALRLAFHIPLAIPLDGKGRVLDRPMDDEATLVWKGGEVGHLQITTRAKPDPGVVFLEHRARAMGIG